MKKVRLTRNKYAIVDDRDFEFVSQYKWYAQPGANTYYAVRQGKRDKNGKRLNYYMHRELLNMKPYKLDKTRTEVDHINKNGLDNRRTNIKPCTKSENAKNRDNRKLANIQCKQCGLVFKPTNSKIIFCSSKCFGLSSYQRRHINNNGTFSARKLGLL